MSDFKRIAILGPGLLGGSIALGLKRRDREVEVVMWGRSPERVAAVQACGFDHVTADLGLAVKGADLVILAVPVGAMEDLAARLVKEGLDPEAFVTDVGSVKTLPHRSAGRVLQQAGIRFIGSHPMAGSEQSGFESADPDLLVGAPCILTNDHGLPDGEVNRLVAFWASLGARAAVMSATEHDRLVARISHLPHVLAVVCALVSLEQEEDGSLAGGGLRDTSRVAAGDPEMWTEILLENREAVAGPLQASISMLQRLSELIEDGSQQALATVLEDAQRRRNKLTALK
ncbi:MAG: prephenate dehydrogenase/arogenate dehydrogenase family protein [Akkermansiaceae bacterium]|nr:prephenate dehydrogenase/arogenate dehydrogenase family protein [Akkermansiaceae bacterium]NNM29599.1 prephenate dehydrogenase/arogenate dehydrogenase family protein [Akkermansiaceae bacterium]